MPASQPSRDLDADKKVLFIGIGLFSLLLGVLFVLNVSSGKEAIARVYAMEGVNIAVGIRYLLFGILSKGKAKK